MSKFEKQGTDTDRLYELYKLVRDHDLRVELTFEQDTEAVLITVYRRDDTRVAAWEFSGYAMKVIDDPLGDWLVDLRQLLAAPLGP